MVKTPGLLLFILQRRAREEVQPEAGRRAEDRKEERTQGEAEEAKACHGAISTNQYTLNSKGVVTKENQFPRQGAVGN